MIGLVALATKLVFFVETPSFSGLKSGPCLFQTYDNGVKMCLIDKYYREHVDLISRLASVDYFLSGRPGEARESEAGFPDRTRNRKRNSREQLRM